MERMVYRECLRLCSSTYSARIPSFLGDDAGVGSFSRSFCATASTLNPADTFALLLHMLVVVSRVAEVGIAQGNARVVQVGDAALGVRAKISS